MSKIEINYAKTAKKMDMKKLKNSMWSLLTGSPEKAKEVCFKCPQRGRLSLGDRK